MKKMLGLFLVGSLLGALFVPASVFAEKPYQFTPVPIVSDGVEINYAGRRVVQYYPPSDPDDPVRVEPVALEADRYQISFHPPKNPIAGMQLVDLVPDSESHSQPVEETHIIFKTDLMVFNDATKKNASVVLRARREWSDLHVQDGFMEWTQKWVGQNYTVTLDMVAGMITVTEYDGSAELLVEHQWQGEFNLKPNVGYSIVISNLYDEADSWLSVTEKSVDYAGRPVLNSILNVKFSTLGFGPLDTSILPDRFSVGTNGSHVVFWNTSLSQEAVDLPEDDDSDDDWWGGITP